MQESDGISPTAIRELMLLELKHEHLIHLDSVHLNPQAGQLLLSHVPGCTVRTPHCTNIPSALCQGTSCSPVYYTPAGPVPVAGL
jgi:hypothetical protein